nr:hypothetical protein [Kibdelosporangium sp. MJ126-NF4]CEL23222.1 hypothetical protein [Kibdelosporangium sp. MJ126-NF4]CTQ94385.1 hypothetical protein [Kibdelosporangium sp. MJ126-NF4]
MAENSVTGVDGTFEPAPPPLLTDPLAGLVTGLNLPRQRRDELPLAKPDLPDPDDIRAAVEAALDEEAEPPAPQEPTQSERPPAVKPVLMLPLRQWPAAAVSKLRATKDRIQAPPAERKPAGMRSGMAVVIVIVLVTVVILYFVITSLVHTFSQLFG